MGNPALQETRVEVSKKAKRITVAAALAVAGFGGTRESAAWNEIGHRLVVEKAIEALPKPIKQFYERHRGYLLEQVKDPARTEPRIVFEVDRLEPFPFEGLPEERQAAIAKYGEEKIREAGDLPWKLMEVYLELVEAFRGLDQKAIEARSAELAYYVGELHVPLNLSNAGDGDPFGRQGFRERLDSRLLELFGGKLRVSASTAIYLDRPAEYALSMVRETYVWVDNLLLLESIAGGGTTSYSSYYYDGLWARASPVVNERLSRSAENLASYWYTAWIAAGKPELRSE